MEAHSLWDLVLENPTWSGSRTRAPYVPERDRAARAKRLRGADRGLFYEPDLVGFTDGGSLSVGPCSREPDLVGFTNTGSLSLRLARENPTWSGSQMEAHSLWDLVLENPTWSGSQMEAHCL